LCRGQGSRSARKGFALAAFTNELQIFSERNHLRVKKKTSDTGEPEEEDMSIAAQ
jgi:hypothetical protein